MLVERFNKLDRIVASVASWYSRRVWWIQYEELYQEGWLIAIECERSWTESDDLLGGYCWNAIKRSLARYCWAQSSPVSSSKAEEMSDVFRAPAPDDKIASSILGPEDALVQAQAEARIAEIQQELHALFVKVCGSMLPEHVQAVELVLLCNMPSREAAKLCRIPDVWTVYRATKCVKDALVANRSAKKLLAELQDRRIDL